MELSALANHLNDKDTYKMLEKYVNLHNDLNNLAAAAPKKKPNEPKPEPDIKIDKNKLDKAVQAELDKLMKKHGFTKK